MADNYETWNGQTMPMGITGSPSAKIDPSSSTGFNTTMTFVPALTTLIGVSAYARDLEAENEAIERNMESFVQSYSFSQNIKEQQLKDLERATGDKMSASGLERLKTESRLKAGEGSEEAVNQAAMNQLHTDSAILRTYEVQKSSQLQQMLGDQLGFENQMESMASGMRSTESAFLQSLNIGMASFNTGLNYLNTTQKEELFNTEKA